VGRFVYAPEEACFRYKMLLVKAYSPAGVEEAVSAGADRVYYNVFSKDYPLDVPGVCPYVPRCLGEHMAEKALSLVSAYNPKSVLCGDIGVSVSLPGREVFLDISGNVFNDCAVGFYNRRGVVPVVSPELSFDELSGFSDKRFCVYAHGRVPLMSTKYVLSAERLVDEKGYVFPVRREVNTCRSSTVFRWVCIIMFSG